MPRPVSHDVYDEEPLEVQDEPEEEEVHITYDIAAYPSDHTLSVVKEMWDAGDIIVPHFQRNYVWSIKQASLLIESFLAGLPVPQVFFYIDEYNKAQVIDGQQRIMSVVYFIDGYFGSENIQGKKQVFRLQGLAKNSPFFRKTFEELSEPYQRKIRGSVLRAINIRQLNPTGDATSIYHIFERLNTGGTPLKPQEIRNCVYRGQFVELLRNLNRDPNWRKIVGKSSFDRHQKDVELILRIYGLAYYFDEYEKPMKEFLNKIMSREKKSPNSINSDNFSVDFPKVAREIVEQLGEKPFHLRGPLNSSALDAVFAVLLQNYSLVPEDLKERYQKLNRDKNFQSGTFYSTSDLVVVKDRFSAVEKYLIG